MAEKLRPSELARRWGVSSAYVSKCLKKGWFAKDAAGLIDLDAANAARAAHSHPARSKRNATPGGAPKRTAPGSSPSPQIPGEQSEAALRLQRYIAGVSYADANTAKVLAQAQKVLAELQQTTQALIPRKDVEAFIFEALRNARNRFLGLPEKMAPRLAPLEDPRELAAELDAEVRNILNDLADAMGEIPNAVAGPKK